MTTTARKVTAQIISTTADLLDLVVIGLFEDFDDCELCGLPSADLYDRLTEDGDQVRSCETCVHEHHLGYVAD